MNSLPLSLLPDTATIGDKGQLLIGGCDTLELAEQFGTPLFVYDEAHLRARCREAVAAFGVGVNFATKAFLCTAMARLAAEEGCNLDVSTGGEYHVARAAGIPADRLVLHGNNKSTAELRTAMSEGIGRIIIDSFDEIDRIEALVAEGLPVPRALIRVTPGVEAHTHEFVRTGQDDSKFGFGLASGQADAAVLRAIASPAIDLVGLHAHIGSQVFDAEFFEMAIEVMAPFVQKHQLPEFSVGKLHPSLNGARLCGQPVWPLASRHMSPLNLVGRSLLRLRSRCIRWAPSKRSRISAPMYRSTEA